MQLDGHASVATSTLTRSTGTSDTVCECGPVAGGARAGCGSGNGLHGRGRSGNVTLVRGHTEGNSNNDRYFNVRASALPTWWTALATNRDGTV